MKRAGFTKRDFLKISGITALACGWSAVTAPAYGAASALRKAFPQKDPEWDRIRACFPLTRDRVYFNNGTLGPAPAIVTAAITAALEAVEVSGESREADREELRSRLAEFVGAAEDEIALTHNTTEGVNIVASGLSLTEGDEVIVTTHEHVGGALPWLNRARRDGVVIRTFRPLPTAAGVLEMIRSILSSRTRVIAIPHISCTTGQVFPIEEIAQLARNYGILLFVDGAHGTGMLSLNLRQSGVHFYASCLHKWLCGPKGVGYLFIRRENIAEVEPRFVGARSDSGWSLEPVPQILGFSPGARRLDYGSQNTALYAGGIAALDFFTRAGLEKISAHGRRLAERLQSALLAIDGVEMLTPVEPTSRGMIVSFKFRDSARDSVRFAAFAAQKGFRIRQVSEAGLGAVRVSTHLYNTASEVDRFAAIVAEFR